MTTRASVSTTARIVAGVLAPTLAVGPIQRRRSMLAVIERLGLDDRAVRVLVRARQDHGPGPLLLRLPGIDVVLPLEPEQVRRILVDDAAWFAPASAEKQHALTHFQPHGVLASRGPVRQRRRAVVERALQTGHPVHDLHAAVERAVDDATAGLPSTLDWPTLARHWWPMVRQIVLGESARDDTAVTDDLTALRARANWSFAAPVARRRRERFLRRMDDYVRLADPDSLAGALAATPADDDVDPAGQLPQWLFAFEAAGIATLRTLALLATHPEQDAIARQEVRESTESFQLPYLRACVRDCLRLWPTTPVILRESVSDTTWPTGTMPAGSTVVVHASYFHRGPHAGEHAHQFDPAAWLDGSAFAEPALVPFSAGPAACPGRDVVLLTAAAFLARLLDDRRYELLAPDTLSDATHLSGTLDHFAIRMGPAVT